MKETGHHSQLGTSEFPVETNRYLVYIALACPWASRVSAVIDLLGLDEHIEVVSVAATMERTKPEDPTDDHIGWMFAKEKKGRYIRPDPIFNARSLRDVYEKCGDFKGRFSTPVLFDKVSKTIVNNESSEIIRMLETEFIMLTRNPIDLYPLRLRSAIDEVNDWVYKNINIGVYKAGFAQSQQPYDEAVAALFEHLDKAETILSKSRYLCSNKTLTEADIRLFETLIRFDQVYHTHFKCNCKQIKDYPNLNHFMREIYQLVPHTVDIDEIKKSYYSQAKVNPHRIIARGPPIDFDSAHDREKKFPQGVQATTTASD